MKFLLKPVLALALLVMAATSVKAQDTLKISLKEAIQIALSENPTIKVADQEIQLKKEANRETLYGLLPEANLVLRWLIITVFSLFRSASNRSGSYIHWTLNLPARVPIFTTVNVR